MTDSTFSGKPGVQELRNMTEGREGLRNPDSKWHGPFDLPKGTVTWTPPSPMTADQQIRAKALEHTVGLHMAERGWEPQNSSAFWKCLLEFEAYIRDGK